MNTPDEITVDAEAERLWLNAYKDKTGLSWGALGRSSGIPHGTLSPWATGVYLGNADNVAARVFRFRQQVESQADLAAVALKAPDFIATPTALRLRELMVSAQSGGMTMGCTAPGLGKTIAAEHYARSVSNAWLITMRPSSGNLTAMISATLAAIGNTPGNRIGGWKSKLSQEVSTLIAGRNGVLIYDEANFLTMESLEEIRSWAVPGGAGVCLLGNEELFAKVRGGARNHAFGRLNGRIKMSHLAEAPEPGDVEAYLDAWQIEKPSMRNLLSAIAMTPGSGALREMRQIIELANTLAHEDGVAMGLSHLRDAQSTRTTRNIRVAS